MEWRGVRSSGEITTVNIFFSLYNEVLYRPLLNGLIWFYDVLPWQDLGLAIIALTVVIRVLLTPFLWKAQKAQKDLAAIQPEIKKIQEQFKNDREGQGRALMELYAGHKVNPFSGCLLMLIQLPILIALFQVFQKVFKPEELRYLYSFVANPGMLDSVSLGLIDLAKGNIYLGVVAAATQFLQTKFAAPMPKPSGDKKDFSSILQMQATYIFPALILVWSYTLPSALTLYWTILNILAIVQEIVMRKPRIKTTNNNTNITNKI